METRDLAAMNMGSSCAPTQNDKNELNEWDASTLKDEEVLDISYGKLATSPASDYKVIHHEPKAGKSIGLGSEISDVESTFRTKLGNLLAVYRYDQIPEGLYKQIVAIYLATRKPACDKPDCGKQSDDDFLQGGEKSDNDLLGQLGVPLMQVWKNETGVMPAAKAILELFHAHLATRKPVPVSLEKCGEAILDAGYMGNNSFPEDFVTAAKAVLDAAGVKCE